MIYIFQNKFVNFYFYLIIIIKIVFDREVNWIFDLVKLRVLYEVLKQFLICIIDDKIIFF